MDNWEEVIGPVYHNLLKLAEKRHERKVTAREAEALMNLVQEVFAGDPGPCGKR